MRHLIITLLVGFMTFGLAIDNADARRMGGGHSMGSYSRSATSSSSAAQRPAATPNQTPARQGGRFAGGLFAGLLAGGLIAALFGGAFHGINMTDMLLLALVAFAVIMFLKRRRTTAAANNTGNQQNTGSTFNNQQAYTAAQGTSFGSSKTPAWFNRERFLTDAKQHFTHLQQAWDANNLAEIQDYVTPELYNLLKAERAKEPANNKTEVVRLLAELGDIQEYGQQAEASILFHGVLIENGQQTDFSEVWHLVRDMRDQAPWYIQGIEQRN